MNEANQGSNPDALAIVPVKRKRGRPRKYPRRDLDHGGYANVPRDRNPAHGENAHVSPGFGRANENQPRSVDTVNDSHDVMVGQEVHGVIEAAFDAGYLLTVRVGNSESTLRGVVFKPGHYVPVSNNNDVAPGVQMIIRNEIPIPRENFTQVHSHNRWSGSRNETAHASRSAYSMASKSKQVTSMVTQTASPAISRGNTVPVVLQPINSSNRVPAGSELPSDGTQASHLVAAKGKQVMDAAYPSNGATNNVVQLQSQNNHHMMPSGMQSETCPPNHNPAEALNESDAKSGKAHGMPFEKLLTEVIKRLPAPPQSMEPESSSTPKLSANDSGSTVEDDLNDTDHPLTIEPLQAIQPDLHCHPAAVSTPLDNCRTGKMTELLQVLQESMIERQAKLDEQRRSETEPEDEDGDHSKKPSRSSSV